MTHQNKQTNEARLTKEQEEIFFKWFHDNDIHVHVDKITPLLKAVAQEIRAAEIETAKRFIKLNTKPLFNYRIEVNDLADSIINPGE